MIFNFVLSFMETIRVDILHPEAKKLLDSLADLNLISIRKSPKNDFSKVLSRLRSKSETAPTIDEITREVQIVRSKRYNR